MNNDEVQILTAEQCDELAVVLSEAAAVLSPGPKKEGLLNLAQAYRNLAEMKRIIARQLN
jgi:hypothetical protein